MRESIDAVMKDSFEAPYILASYYLIEAFISKGVADDHFKTFDSGDGERRMESSVGMRIATIGETLFRFRKSRCVTEFCERMANRDLKAAFSEALSASFFLDEGFEILAIKETGHKGEDFDFRAKKAETIVCVEVTTLQPSEFSDKTVENALGAKVDQLPRHLPSVIVVVLPEAWLESTDAVERLHRQARKLFGYSGRVNYVCYLSEQHADVTIAGRAHGMLQYRLISCRSHRARTECAPLDFLINLRGEDLSASALFEALQTDAEVHRAFRQRPFFRWVDQLVGRC